MNLKINIHKIKCINDLMIEFPTEKGLYAITGQNGSGKSTIAACASSAFFHLPMKQFFGKTDDGASITFEFNSSKRANVMSNGKWSQTTDGPKMDIKGFYEGSLIFGNRFKDMIMENIYRLDSIDQNKLFPADDFIRKNLGIILQGDENFYEKVWAVSHNYEGFKGNIFYYEKNGKRISQFHMSTGENLLVSILNSLYIRNNDRASLAKPCLMFLDEIELALHPSSLKRLILFLKDMSDRFNYAIYFSTHSIELISNIAPSNIFFIERHSDGTINVINPCYPAYATRILYDHSGYDKIILVEDDLAKSIVDRLLRKEKLLNSKLVHVLPCGGYMNVLDLANDVVKYNILGRRASISIILDGDVKELSEQYLINNGITNNIPLNFLPIESLEKYLRNKLFVSVDHILYRSLEDYIFQIRSLSDLIDEYKHRGEEIVSKDKNGKVLYSIIDNELKERRIDRAEMIKIVVDHLFDSNDNSLNKLSVFLKRQMEI